MTTSRLQEFERKLRKKKLQSNKNGSDNNSNDHTPERPWNKLCKKAPSSSPTLVSVLVVILSVVNIFHHVNNLGGFAENGKLLNMTSDILYEYVKINESLSEMSARVEGVYSKLNQIKASATLMAEAFNSISMQGSGLKIGNKNTLEVQDNANRTHWCILIRDKLPIKSEHFDHFPHTSEVALPCWSWFRSQHATNDCGFVLVGDLQLDRDGKNSWQNQLIRQHMKCKVKQVDNEEALLQLTTTTANQEVYHHPNLKFMRPRAGYRNWLKEPDDAQALRRAVGVSDEWVALHKGNGKPLQVGVVKRTNRRIVTNMDDIFRGLQSALPGANVTMSTLEDAPTVLDQARWFASKHIIIGTHGAGLTNCVFITKGTFVLQLYPPGFHWQYYDPLIEQSGGIALDWGKGEHPLADTRETNKHWWLKNKAQHGNFEVPVNEVLDTILVALEKKIPNADMVRRSQY